MLGVAEAGEVDDPEAALVRLDDERAVGGAPVERARDVEALAHRHDWSLPPASRLRSAPALDVTQDPW